MERQKNESGTPLWGVEKGRQVHTRTTVTMDHTVDPEVLQRALDETLKVYPILQCSTVLEDGAVWFVPNDVPCKVRKEIKPVVPGSDELDGHTFYVACEGNRIRLCVSHVVTDGGGVFAFQRTLFYYYACFLDGKTYDNTGIQVKPGEHRDADFWTMDYSDVKPVPAESFEKIGYVLPEMAESKNEVYYLSTVTVPEEQFIRMSKERNTSPAVMIFLLFAEAVYRVREDAADQPIAGRITADARRALGIPDTFRNCSLGAQLSVRREDFGEDADEGLAEKLRASLRTQTSEEMLRYAAKNVAETRSFPRDLKPTVSISYMGSLSFGPCDEHIREVHMAEGEFHKINACTFRGEFRILLHTGSGSETYAQAMADILREKGLEAAVSSNEILEKEVTDA